MEREDPHAPAPQGSGAGGPGTPPIVCVVGWKDSGKTGFVVRLVDELVSRGYEVMTIKHGHHFRVDTPGTDSWRHRAEGGASRVVMAGPDELALVGGWGPGGELSPREIAARFLPDADLVVAEGYKHARLPKIEIHRSALHPRPIYDPDDPSAGSFLAVVTDLDDLPGPAHRLHPRETRLPARVADLIEAELMGGSQVGDRPGARRGDALRTGDASAT